MEKTINKEQTINKDLSLNELGDQEQTQEGSQVYYGIPNANAPGESREFVNIEANGIKIIMGSCLFPFILLQTLAFKCIIILKIREAIMKTKLIMLLSFFLLCSLVSASVLDIKPSSQVYGDSSPGRSKLNQEYKDVISSMQGNNNNIPSDITQEQKEDIRIENNKAIAELRNETYNPSKELNESVQSQTKEELDLGFTSYVLSVFFILGLFYAFAKAGG